MTTHCPFCNQPWEPKLELRFHAERAFFAEKGIRLNRIQVKLLELLYKRRGQMLADDRIFEYLYGARPDGGPETETIKVHVCRIRTALARAGAPFQIIRNHTGYTVRDGGYTFIEVPHGSSSSERPEAFRPGYRLRAL